VPAAEASSPRDAADLDGDGDVDLDDLRALFAFPAKPADASAPEDGADIDQPPDSGQEPDGIVEPVDGPRQPPSADQDPTGPDSGVRRVLISRETLLVNDGPLGTNITLRLRAGAPSVLEVDFGDDGTAEYSFDRSLFDHIVVNAGGGDDVVRIDEYNGVFTDSESTTLNGGSGQDVLLGGSGGETFRGGGGGDQIFAGPGDDRLIWNPGDGTDLNEGAAGVDTVEVNGGNAAEQFTVTANGTRVRFDRLSPGPFALDIGTCENLVLNAHGGDDSLSCTGNLAALIKVTADGGPGNDSLLGTNGIDVLIGGEGNDFIDGQQGNDVVFMGSGDDTFQWDPGDGSDTVEGQDGQDVMLFNGSGANEIFDLSANGPRLRLTRNVGNIVMDVAGVEHVRVSALGGADAITVNDLADPYVTLVDVDLSGTLGGASGDAQADTVIVNATNADDIIDVLGAGTSVSVLGLAARVNLTNSEGANDALVVNALGGNDGVTATTLPAGIIKLTLDGGADDDTLLGSQGADVFLGGAGDDFIFGDNGNDVAFMGADADVFQWDPGDGSDTIEGQGGADTLLFFGSNASENISIAANGGRVLFTRDVGSVTMDLDDVERIEFRALGGADNIVAGDLSGTDVTGLGLDLRGPDGGGDGSADTVAVTGTNSADVFGAAGDAGGVSVFGLQATVDIFSSEPANDRLTLNAQGGDDVVDATSLEADAIQLTINGGLGNDVLIGSEGDDQISGGDGNDLALMGAGDDTFTWNPGDDNDTLEGQAGFDTMLFNGANVSEVIDIFANGGRVLFTRSVASVIMDLNDVERVDFTARGGADNVTTGDLSGTDVTEINLNLESFPGSGVGDGQVDRVVVNGTSADDVIIVTGSSGSVTVLGLAALVSLTGSEPANDRLTINALAGDDVVDASGLAATAVQLVLDGGADNDVLIGSDGADVIFGGDGDDVLLGGPGIDVLDGGPGDNIIIQD